MNVIPLSSFLFILGMMSAIPTSCLTGTAKVALDSTNKGNRNTEANIANNNKSDSSSNKTKIRFDPSQPFELISVKTGITKSSSSYPDTSMCNGWTIPVKVIPEIIESCKIVSGEEIHYGFEVWPCVVSGFIRQNDHQFKYEINGGSWIWISSEDTTILLASSKKKNEKYFITKEWDGKE